MAQDIKIKRAEYIIKNCELNQEFIEKSVKIAPKQLLNFIVKDMRSVTGKNLKRILLLTNKRKFDDVTDADIEKIVYAEMPSDNGWRVPYNAIKTL